MSSHFRPTRKTQKTPKFCFRKKPIIHRFDPCPDYPSIGDSPFVTLRVSNPSGGPGNGSIVADHIYRLIPTTQYHTTPTDQYGYHYDIFWNIVCSSKQHSLTISSDNPLMGISAWASIVEDFPPDQKNCDTGWFQLFPTGGPSATKVVARIYL